MLKVLPSNKNDKNNKNNNTKYSKTSTEDIKNQKSIYSFYKNTQSVVAELETPEFIKNSIENKIVSKNKSQCTDEKENNVFIDTGSDYDTDYETDRSLENDENRENGENGEKYDKSDNNEDNEYKNINNYLKNSTPWVEKYRPVVFEEIVLDPLNKKLLKNIIDNNYFPNLLFYGPPGTGKTTTIINLVNMYQEKMNLKNKGLMIHLNASDERGIDIIRNQINSFVNSKSLFGEGMKFVILDEVDYMTKTAQIALRYLLNNYNNNYNVRFCLICNYISRIDESLQTEFVRMRFNQLPEPDIIKFLQKINENENLHIKPDILISIQKYFMSDIRSMINYMQTNQDLIHECKIIKNDLWVKLTKDFIKNKKHADIVKKINYISRDYNIEPKNMLKIYLNYIIRNHNITKDLLYNIENIMHIQNCKTEHVINYIIYKLKLFFADSTNSSNT
jgi:DNA polymerase III delta prime subunit